MRARAAPGENSNLVSVRFDERCGVATSSERRARAFDALIVRLEVLQLP